MIPLISIIVLTKNNADIIGRCLRSIRDMDYPQDRVEIIVSDAESNDNTLTIAEEYNVKIVMDCNHSIVSGRNVAFKEVSGEYIALCDSDCVVDKKWLINSLKYFENDKVAGIGGANLIPEDESPFAKAVGLIFAYAPYITKAAHTRILNKVIESRSHASNSIYRTNVLKQVFPIDEILTGGEDVIMTDKIEDLGYKLLYVPDVIVKHYRRSDTKKWWKQMVAYGRGRVLLPRYRKGEVTLAHKIVGFGILIVVLSSIVLVLINPAILLWTIIGYLYLSILVALVASKDVIVGFNMPLVLGVFLFAWSYGYMKELFRLK